MAKTDQESVIFTEQALLALQLISDRKKRDIGDIITDAIGLYVFLDYETERGAKVILMHSNDDMERVVLP